MNYALLEIQDMMATTSMIQLSPLYPYSTQWTKNALKFDFSRDARSLTTKGRIEGYEMNHMAEAEG